MGVLRPVSDTSRTTGPKLRVQQDEKSRVVRVELRCQKRKTAIRQRAGQIYTGGRVRRVRTLQVSQVGQVFPNVRTGIQILFGLRELELRRLRDRKVFRQRTTVSLCNTNPSKSQ